MPMKGILSSRLALAIPWLLSVRCPGELMFLHTGAASGCFFRRVSLRFNGSFVLMAHIERGRDEIKRQEHGEEESADHADAAAGTDFIADAPPERHRQHADHARDRGH